MTHLPHQHDGNSQHISQHIPAAETFQTAAQLFRQLGDGTRIRIFWILCHCEECVINLSAMMEMSSPAVSHHLRQLRESGLVISRRDGKEVIAKTMLDQIYYDKADEIIEMHGANQASLISIIQE